MFAQTIAGGWWCRHFDLFSWLRVLWIMGKQNENRGMKNEQEYSTALGGGMTWRSVPPRAAPAGTPRQGLADIVRHVIQAS